MVIILCILFFIIGGFITYLITRPLIKNRVAQDLEVEKINDQLYKKNEFLSNNQQQLIDKIKDLDNNYNSLLTEIKYLEDKKNILENNYEQANKNAELYRQKATDLANEKFTQSAERMAQEYQKAEEDYQQEYLKVIKETAEGYKLVIEQKQSELQQVLLELQEAKAKQDVIIEANKRAEEVKQKEQFYKLNLSETDIEEIKKLRSIIPYLRSAEPINKVIWKVYYEKPYTDLIGRVIGQGIHSGIYKITNIENQKCYVGQSVDLSGRWRQHIKRGVGAEAPTRNKLYSVMYEIGPENFTFEVLEECDKSQLDEREKFYIDFYQAKEYGYSIKAG